MGKIRSMMPGAVLLLVLLLCTACGAKQMPVDVIKTAFNIALNKPRHA